MTARRRRDLRDLAIAAAYARGLSLRGLAAVFGLSASRIHQIVRAVGDGYTDPDRYMSDTERADRLPTWLRSLRQDAPWSRN
jgi:transposase